MKEFGINPDERSEQAVAFFKEGYNCSQSVFLAYHDVFGIEREFAATLAAPLGGGMGRLREVCGAVTAVFLLAGLKYPANDPIDKTAKARNYRVVQELAEKFSQKNGSIVCRELLNLDHRKDTPEPSERTEQYYQRRPCAEYVAIAAKIIGEKLNEKESD